MGMDDLSKAIVLQAVDDFKSAFWGNEIDLVPPAVMINDCERFFNSSEFEMMCDLDGGELSKKLKLHEINIMMHKCRMCLSSDTVTSVIIKYKKKGKNNKWVTISRQPLLEPLFVNYINQMIALLENMKFEIELGGNKRMKNNG